MAALNPTAARPAPLEPGAVGRALAPFGESRTLPATAYLSTEVMDWELDHFFAPSWECLGRGDELVGPDQARAIRVGKHMVLLVRDRAGTVRGFHNVCRHRGHELLPAGEAVDVRLIRCPYHSWSYGLDGALRAAPTFTQAPGFDPTEYPLAPVAVAEWGGWLFVTTSGPISPLDEQLGNLDDLLAPYEPERLVVAAEHRYEVAANWKLVVENYHECYHCATIHPALCRVSPPSSGRDFQPTGLWCGGTMALEDEATTMSFDGSSEAVPLRGLSDEARRSVLYVGLFPNLLVSAHPDYVMTHRIEPVAPDRSLIECQWLFAPESVEQEGFDPAYAVDFWDVTNREDWSACEGVQRGIRSPGFRPGPLSPWESTVYQFIQLVATGYLGRRLVPPVVPQAQRL